MRFDFLTLFPEMVEGPLGHSIVKRARDKGLLEVNARNIRDFAEDKHRVVDDTPYGGGPGMVMKVDVLHRAVEAVREKNTRIIMMDPGGILFTQKQAEELALEEHLLFLCGHYEGIDERVREIYKPLCLSIGEYVLTNGALAACVVADAVSRLIPGVLGNENSPLEESFSMGYLEYPQYTRPREFQGHSVPEVLLSGNHQKIDEWRKKEALKRTLEMRETSRAPENKEE